MKMRRERIEEKKIKRNDVTCYDWFYPDVFRPNLI